MRLTRKVITDKALCFVDKWNNALHHSFEDRIHAEYKRTFTQPTDDMDLVEKRMQNMREFYYSRMMSTATIIVATTSLIASIFAIIIACVALFTG